jgi:hypothetical protein
VALGVPVYFFYGRHHSTIKEENEPLYVKLGKKKFKKIMSI